MKLYISIVLFCVWANTALSQEQDDGSRGGKGGQGGRPPPMCPPGCTPGGYGGYPQNGRPPGPGGKGGWGGPGGPPAQGGPGGWGGPGGPPPQGGPGGWGGPGGPPPQGGPGGWGGPGGPPHPGGPGGWGGPGGLPPPGGPGGPPNQGVSSGWGGPNGYQYQGGPAGRSWSTGPPYGGPPYGGPPHGGPPHGGPPHGGFGGHGRPPGPPPNMYDMFPSCKELAEAMRNKQREMMQSGEIGPRNCQEQDHKVCMQRDMEKVRCQMTEEPQQECMDQVMAYIQGDVCNEGDGGSDLEKNPDSASDGDSP